MKHLYEFYFEFKKGGEQITAKIQECKKPKQTKIYKLLEENFNEGFIEAFGYRPTQKNK